MHQETKSEVITLENPYITPDLPGIGGRIKSRPDHFMVEEIPLYDAAGEGDHLYVRIGREGWTTRDLASRLAEILELGDEGIGFAGLKDKDARTIQTFSLYLPTGGEEKALEKIRGGLPVEVLSAKRHRNKLKTGHLLGNRFRIVLAGVDDAALQQAEKIAAALLERGIPNYYGVQRFGADGDNAEKGLDVLKGKGPRQKWLRRFLLSAYQSLLFNEWLSERLGLGWFDRLVSGDVAKKTDTGGLFIVEDAETEQPRFESGAITYTGPIYGGKMKKAAGPAGDLEDRILERHGVTPDMLKKARLDGSRRPGRLTLPDLSVRPHEEGLYFEFSLPKGSYATTVLREFSKTDLGPSSAD